MNLFNFQISTFSNYLIICFVSLFLFFYINTSNAQLSFNNGLTAQQLAQMLAGPGVTISNATINCASNAIGSFSGSSSIGIASGILLTTGSTSVASPNTGSGSAGTDNGLPGDPQLNSLAGATTYDACALEFDIIPLCDTVSFNYSFGSDEYPEFVNSGFNDAFAFYISGPGITGQPNIAQLPGTSTFVTIDNVNDATNSQYYVANSGTTIEYDGYTTVLTAWILVQACQSYHMKIVIADAGDGWWDSGVFLETGSIHCQTVSASATVQNAVEGCQDGAFEFCRPVASASPLTVNYTIAGTAINGSDYNTISSSITIPAGQLCVSLPIVPIADGVSESTETIFLIYQPGPCPLMDTAIISVIDNSPLNAGPDVTICSGESANIGIPPVTGTTYSWSPTSGLSNPAISNPSLTLTNGGASPVTTNYILTASIGGCASSDTVAATVTPLPFTDAGPDQTICSGAVTLAGSISGSSTMGIWTGGTGIFNPSDTSLNGTYTPSASEMMAGSITLTLTPNDSGGSCASASDQIVITINSLPNSLSTTTICSGGSTSIGISPVAGTTYSWAPATGLSNAAISNPSVTLTNGGALPVTSNYILTANAGGCISYDSVAVTVNPLPFANAGPDQTICSSSATLAGATNSTTTIETWSGGAGIFNPSDTSLNCTYTPTASEITAGSVTLTLTTDDPTGTCTSASDQMVIFISPPATVFAGSDQTTCIGNTVTLEGLITGTVTDGIWTGGTGTYNPDNTDPTAVYTPSTAEATAGSVILTFSIDDSSGFCPGGTDQMILTINQLPTANAGLVQYVCPGSGIALAGSIGGSSSSGTWSGGGGTYSPDDTTLNAVYTPSAAEYAADSVVLTLTTNDPAGPCTFSSSTVTFHFYENPIVDFMADTTAGCPVLCTDFTDLTFVSGGAAIAAWNWDFGDISSGSDIPNPSHCFSQSGSYNVTLTATSTNGCVSFLTKNEFVQVFNFPVAAFDPAPNPATVLDPTITFNNQSSPDVNYWNWNFGDSITLAPDISNPVHVYPDEASGSYQATLIVHNADGCYDTIAHEIIIGPAFTFFIPNSFTPDEDEINDYFFGSGIGITKFDLWIFDRWGNMIFHGKELNDKWDGKVNDSQDLAQTGVYVWKVQLIDVLDKKHSYIGSVTLVQ